MSHQISVDLVFVHDLAAGYDDLVVAGKMRAEVAVGTTTGKGNRALRLATTVSASGTVPIDLAALTGPAGETIALDDVQAIGGRIITPGGTGTLAKGASNGFTGFGTDWSFTIYGARPFLLPCSSGLTVDSTHKTMTFTNTGGSSVDIEIFILGRDA